MLNKRGYVPRKDNVLRRPPRDPASVLDYFQEIEDEKLAIKEMAAMMEAPISFFSREGK